MTGKTWYTFRLKATCQTIHVFRQEALNTPGIKLVSHMSETPTNMNNGTGGVNWDGKRSE